MSEDVSPHDLIDDGVRFWIWLSLEDVVHWGLSGQSESTKGIHNKIDPKHLDGVQWGVTKDCRAEEDDGHSSEIDGKLELQEFSDTVVDVTAVLEGHNNRSEVIIKKDNIRGTLGDVSTCDTHGETDIGLLQGGGVVGTITSDGDDTITGLNTSNQDTLVQWG